MNKIVEEDILNILSQNIPWDKMSGCQVLVTGAGGFLGGYLVRTLVMLNINKLLDKPVLITATVREISSGKKQLVDVLNHPYISLIECDLSDPDEDKIKGFNYILHAASLASPKFYGVDPIGTIEPNIIGTSKLLNALDKSSEPRGFLFVSSSEIYGKQSDSQRLSEKRYGVVDPTLLRSCYAESKRMGEALCIAWAAQRNTPTFIVRPFHIYGPGLKEDDGRVFADFAFNVLKNENLIIKSDGTASRSFCYVSDAISGFFTVLLKGDEATPYNIANPSGELSVSNLAEMLVGLFPHKNLMVKKESQPDHSYMPSQIDRVIPDTKKVSGLGWYPTISPEVGFKRMIESYV